jgi:hypothetical protein
VLADEGGYVLVWAIVAFVILGALAAASLRSVQVQRGDARAAVEWNESFFAAESGLRALVAQADSLTDGLAPGDSVIVGWTMLSGTARYRGSIQRVDSGTGKELYYATSVGAGGGLFGGRAELRLVFGEGGTSLPKPGFHAKNYLLASGNMKIGSYDSREGPFHPANTYKNAQVYSNGNIDVANKNSQIWGDATAAGTVTVNGTVTGTVTSSAPPLTYDPEPCPPGSYTSFIPGSDMTLPGGTYLFSDVFINSKSISVAPGDQVEIYVSGPLTIRSSSKFNWDHGSGYAGDAIIYGCGGATDTWMIAKAATHVHAVIYAPNDDLVVEGGATVYGGITARNLNVGSSGSVWQDEALAAQAPLTGFSEIKPRAWSQSF